MEEDSALTRPDPVREPDPARIPDPASDPGRSQASRMGRLVIALALALILLTALLVWEWYDTRQQMSALREEMALRLRESETEGRGARDAARESQEAARGAQVRLTQLEAKLAESQNQQVAMEALYRELSRGRDEWVLAEVEQILSIAVQQLQLAGSVQAGLAALQTADSRLARSDRPQFKPLREALARDIERLVETAGVDIHGLAQRLDKLIARVDELPLALGRALEAEPASTAARTVEGFWRRLGSDLWSEFTQIVRVRKIDRPEPPLVSPSQAFFLRENLKLRLLHARLALLTRERNAFRADLSLASNWIRRYFDLQARPVASALADLDQLAASPIRIDLPSITESVNAVRNYKLSSEKAAR